MFRALALGRLALGTATPRSPACAARLMSTANPASTAQVEVVVSQHGGKNIATVSLSKAPVNSLSSDFLDQIRSVMESIEAGRAGHVDGVVVTSALPTVFSAGLDINAMYGATPETFAPFWTSLQKMWMALYGTKLPTAAAITGHAPAGGCIVSMCCDYRVMASGDKKFRIGLNETQLGIVAPEWARLQMERLMGKQNTDAACAKGTLFTAEEAVQVGLVNKVADSRAECLQLATDWVVAAAGRPVEARLEKKFKTRKADIEKVSSDLPADIQATARVVLAKAAQENMGAYLASLKKKK